MRAEKVRHWRIPGSALDHDGSLYACDHYVYSDYRLGDLLNDDLGEMARRSLDAGFGPHDEADVSGVLSFDMAM